MNTQASPIEVYVRVRPQSQREKLKKERLSVEISGTEIILHEPFGEGLRSFNFQGVLPEDSNNTDVFESTTEHCLRSLEEGFNCTCFTYGSTGAGKTHTMIGNIGECTFDPGLIFQTAKALFDSEPLTLSISYLEIYNERVIDLMKKPSSNLNILEDHSKGIYIPDLSEHIVNSLEELYTIILTGNKNRTMAATSANEISSRSHAILQLNIYNYRSKLCLVDLAGSERAASTHNKGKRLVEGGNINKSLLALGNCIHILSDTRKKGRHVPYRDSKLTRLLKNSLGGSTKTVMIACISPSRSDYENTAHTLKYATWAKSIQNQAKANLSLSQGNSEELVEGLSSKLIDIFEEHWQLTNAVSKLDEINDKLRENGHPMTEILGNERKKQELLEKLDRNYKEKEAVHREIHGQKEVNGEMQLQSAAQSLKLEKIDLYIQNHQYRRQVEIAQKKAQEKDEVIRQMREEIESMKNKIEKRTPLLAIDSMSNKENITHKNACLTEARIIKKHTNQSTELTKGTVDFIKAYIPSSDKPRRNSICARKGVFSNLHTISRPKSSTRNYTHH